MDEITARLVLCILASIIASVSVMTGIMLLVMENWEKSIRKHYEGLLERQFDDVLVNIDMAKDDIFKKLKKR